MSQTVEVGDFRDDDVRCRLFVVQNSPGRDFDPPAGSVDDKSSVCVIDQCPRENIPGISIHSAKLTGKCSRAAVFLHGCTGQVN